MGNHVCCTCENDLYIKEHRSNKQERELNRFCDTSEHGCQGCRKEQAASNPFFLWTCAAIHSQRTAWETEDHENKLTGEVTCCIRTEMCNIRGSELCKEDVLTTLDQVAIHHHGAADTSLPEWQIEYVVQTKWNESTLDDTKNQGTDIACASNECTQ